MLVCINSIIKLSIEEVVNVLCLPSSGNYALMLNGKYIENVAATPCQEVSLNDTILLRNFAESIV